MNYNFDEIIDRRYTNAMNVEGYKGYLFGDADTSDLKDNDELIRMWVADMDFQTAPCIIEALQKRVAHGIFGYTLVPDSYYEAITSSTTHTATVAKVGRPMSPRSTVEVRSPRR